MASTRDMWCSPAIRPEIKILARAIQRRDRPEFPGAGHDPKTERSIQQDVLGEQDLAGGRLGRVGSVHGVVRQLGPKTPADGAGRRLGGICRSHRYAPPLDSVVADQDKHDDAGRAGDAVHQPVVIVLADAVGVEPGGVRPGKAMLPLVVDIARYTLTPWAETTGPVPRPRPRRPRRTGAGRGRSHWHAAAAAAGAPRQTKSGSGGQDSLPGNVHEKPLLLVR